MSTAAHFDDIATLRQQIQKIMAKRTRDGHCGVLREDLVHGGHQGLQGSVDGSVVHAAPWKIEQAIEEELVFGGLVQDTPPGSATMLYAPAMFRAERGVASHLRRLLAFHPPWHGKIGDAELLQAKERSGVPLLDSQMAAIRTILGSSVSVLSGDPGCGKTTITNVIVDAIEHAGMKVLQAAPTGKAAKRMEEATKRPARTIQRVLRLDPETWEFRHNRDHPLDADVVVVDESSMVDVELMASLLDAIANGSALILVGDPNQLASVGPGNVLRDIITSGVVPVAHLNEVKRQGAGSHIILNAKRIISGQLPLTPSGLEGSDFYWLILDHPDQVPAMTFDLVTRRLPLYYGLDPRCDIQVLPPMRKTGAGTIALNQALQHRYHGSRRPMVQVGPYRYTIGDRVLHTVNDYARDVYNGDQGIIQRIDVEAQEMVVDYDGHEVFYRGDELRQLLLAYAVTIHKSQGSEYPFVVIPVTSHHEAMLTRNLVYTGVTRGRQVVVLVSDPHTMKKAVSRDGSQDRTTTLRNWLHAA